MKGNFPSAEMLPQQSSSANSAFISLGDSAKDNTLAAYLHTVTQYSTVSQRSVYEAGFIK